MIALALFAIVVKLLLFPLGIKQQKNSVKQAALRPKEMAIRKKYAGRNDKATQQKLNEEIMTLYQSENFNPMAGCLPMLIQLPVLFALYGAIINPIQYVLGIPEKVVAPFLEVARELGKNVTNEIGVINEIIKSPDSFTVQFAALDTQYANIFTPEKVKELYGQFEFFGVNLLETPGFTWPMILIPIFTFVFAFASTKIIRKFTYQPTAAEGAPNMALMDWTMPLLSVWISVTVSGALGIYWMFQNILGALQQIVLAKMYPIKPITQDEIKQAELEARGKGKKSNTSKQVSAQSASPIIERAPIKRRSQKELDEVSVARRSVGMTPKAKLIVKSGKKLKSRRTLTGKK